MWTVVRRWFAERKYGRASEALAARDLVSAERLATELRASGYSAGYEVLARVRRAQGHVDDAVQILRDGTRLAPSVWSLWLLLGCYESDREQYDAAFACFDRALACEHVLADRVWLDRAVLLLRCERFDEALAACTHVRDRDLGDARADVEVGALLGASRFDEVRARVDAETTATSGDEDDGMRARTRWRGVRTLANWLQHRDATRSLREAEEVVGDGYFDHRAARVLRECNDRRSPDAIARRVSIQVTGEFPVQNGETLRGYFRTFEVIAARDEDVLEFVAPFLRATGRDTARIDTATVLGPAPGELEGVVSALGHVFYSGED